MALETKPAWVRELKKKLDLPYSAEELARIKASIRAIEALNAGQHWTPGTFERLLELAREEDEERVN